jgi:hypothetical protein
MARQCRLCLKSRKLTGDHIPPRGCLEFEQLEVRRMDNILRKGWVDAESYVAHKGISFKTLCEDCNEMLGTMFDPALIEFSGSVRLYGKSKLRPPWPIIIDARPMAIARSVLGHLLAAKEVPDESLMDEKVRNFVVDPSAPLPSDLNIFYWFYPFAMQVVWRDIPS